MIDLRHHIYSLVAIFLALALGMLIGVAFIAPGTTDARGVARRQLQIQGLEQKFTVLHDDLNDKQDRITALQSQLDNTEQVCKSLLPLVVKKRLAYRNVAIVQTDGNDTAVAAARSALELAGANVPCSIRISSNFASDSKSLSTALSELGVTPKTEEAERINQGLSVIVDSLLRSRDTYGLTVLEKHSLITSSGPNDRWIKAVVIVGGAESPDKNTFQVIDLPLIELMKQTRAEIVGCETLETKSSCMDAYASKGISTVDDIDKAAGKIGLVYALLGERGHFGVKPTADRLVPQTLERR
jgi:hypothetical protein